MNWYKKSDEDKIGLCLPKEISGWLSRQPESGMGYQRVDLVFSDGSSLLDAIVLNGEELQLPDSFKGKRIKSIQMHREDDRNRT